MPRPERETGPVAALNRLLDAIPRTRTVRGLGDAPRYRSCGVAGYYLALIATLGGGLLAGRSLVVLTALSLACALSFFAYTYARMKITGRERLVLLEHVWFALGCASLTAWGLGVPVLAHLDPVGVGLCVFLAAGRVGCTLEGCCHGRPSPIGISYDEPSARRGFSPHLVGVRLLPVPAIEGLGLIAIGLSGLLALPTAAPGRVFTWFLLAYAVMRFGLEGLRGDRRPHLLGLSQARWMSLAQLVVALRLSEGDQPPHIAIYAALTLTLVVALFLRWRWDVRRSLLAPGHLCEVRERVRSGAEKAIPSVRPDTPVSTTSRGVSVVVTSSGGLSDGTLHVSLAPPVGLSDLRLLCDLAARALPALIPEASEFTGGRTLHLAVPAGSLDAEAHGAPDVVAFALFGQLVRRLQQAAEVSALPTGKNGARAVNSPDRSWYFTPLAPVQTEC